MSVPLELLPHLRRARDLIDREYAEPLDLDRLARVAGVSKYHFLRCFTETYGLTPVQYLAERRIERAQDLLRATNLTVTEICHLVGYTSLGSFSSRFRELVGVPPSSYQARYARSGMPRIPGCFVLMHGLSDRSRNRGEAGDSPAVLDSPHDAAVLDEGGPNDHQRLAGHALRDRPGRGQEVLHRQPRVRGGDRRLDG